MPTIVQRCARRLPFRRTIDMTGVVASGAAMVAMVPTLAADGDPVGRRAVTPLTALRSIPTGTLPVRTAFGPFPTRAFDSSIGFVVPVLLDGELSTSYAWLNNPTPRGLRATPSEVGVGPSLRAAAARSAWRGGGRVSVAESSIGSAASTCSAQPSSSGRVWS